MTKEINNFTEEIVRQSAHEKYLRGVLKAMRENRVFGAELSATITINGFSELKKRSDGRLVSIQRTETFKFVDCVIVEFDVKKDVQEL